MRRSSAQGSLGFAAEQAEGGATPRIQGDRLHLGFVRTRDGQEVLLGVVADGGRSPQSGEVAAILIRAVADAVSQSQSEGLSRALASGLQGATAAWKGSLGEASAQLEASATAVCVMRRRLYVAHAGRSGAFLVRTGQVYPLMKPTGPLGASRADPVAGPREGLELRPGDWVVIASDGLTRTSSETGRPFVDPSEIPGCLRGSEPREAARHLISIALGRDADDNVSVGLIRVPGEARRRSARPVLLGIAAAAAVLIAGLAGAALINRTPETLTDFGYVVVVSGTGLAEIPGTEGPVSLGHLDLVPAGSTLRTTAPMELSLQSTAAERGGLPRATLYLAADTELDLTRLDAYSEGADPEQALAPAVLDLQSGRVLVRLEASRRAVQVRMDDGMAVLDGALAAVLGARFYPDPHEFDCLAGSCAMSVESGPEVVLHGAGFQVPDGVNVALTSDEIRAWSELCAECVAP